MYNLGGFAPFHWANRNKVLILTYHRFSRQQHPSRVSAGEFRLHLEYLRVHNRVLPLTEVIDCLTDGKSLPPNTTVITIDDGYDDAFHIAFPLLKEFCLPATIYAVTDFCDQKIWMWTDKMRYILANTGGNSIKVDIGPAGTMEIRFADPSQTLAAADRINDRLKKLPDEQKDTKIRQIAGDMQVEIPDTPPADFAAMTWGQAREMDAENVRIESHTVTHPILTKVDQACLDLEMRASKKRLEEVFGRPVEHFCYPNGAFDASVRESVKSAGYMSAVTTAYGFNDAKADRFMMNRIDAQSSIESFAQSVSGFEAVKQGMF